MYDHDYNYESVQIVGSIDACETMHSSTFISVINGGK